MSMAAITQSSYLALRLIHGRPLSYQSGSKSIDLDGIPGETPFRFTGGDGGFMRVVSRDWLLLASELVMDGEPIEPERGDLIVEQTAQGGTRTWQVGAPDETNEPAWRHSDRDGIVMRVHVKEIAS